VFNDAVAGDVIGNTARYSSSPGVSYFQAVTSFQGSSNTRQDNPCQHARAWSTRLPSLPLHYYYSVVVVSWCCSSLVYWCSSSSSVSCYFPVRCSLQRSARQTHSSSTTINHSGVAKGRGKGPSSPNHPHKTYHTFKNSTKFAIWSVYSQKNN